MSEYNLILNWDDILHEGDAVNLPVKVIGENISNWKIRTAIYDRFNNELKLATSNVTGGASSQIEITSGFDGEFTIKIANGDTNSFNKSSIIEIEREDSSGNKRTILKKKIDILKQGLDWDIK